MANRYIYGKREFSRRPELQENGYQKAKARKIVDLLLDCAEQSGVTRFQLAKMVSLMSEDQWRTVAFTAGVPVADLPAKRVVLENIRIA